MIRFVLLNTFIVLHSVVFCFWGLLVSLFDGTGRIVHFYCAAPWARSILWVCGIKVSAYGLENIDPGVPRIYITNHQSYFDIFALLAKLPVDFKFIMKQELMRIPLLGFTMKRAGYIGIVREDPRSAIRDMNKAARRIRGGASVLVFPEGTRSKDGRLQPFKKGGFHLALKSGCDIVPVAISGSSRIVPKGSFKINTGSFSIAFGSPIAVGDYNRRNIRELVGRVEAEVKALMEHEQV